MTNLVDLLIVCATFPIQSAFCQSSALASSALSQLIDIHNTLAIMSDANYPAIAQSNTSRSPGLLAAVPDSIRLKHCSLRTEETYVHWIRRFIHFTARGTRASCARRRSLLGWSGGRQALWRCRVATCAGCQIPARRQTMALVIFFRRTSSRMAFAMGRLAAITFMRIT